MTAERGSRRPGARASFLLLLGLVVPAWGCTPTSAPASSGPSAATPSPSASAIIEPTATPRPSPSRSAPPSPTPASAVWTSVIYPYTLELPSGVARRTWAGAIREWDGAERVGTATTQITDRQGSPDGSMIVFGTAWTGTLEEFRDHVLETLGSYHVVPDPTGCGDPEAEVTFDIGGVPAIAFRQTCASAAMVAAVVAVHEGFGLVVRLVDVPPDKQAVVVDDLEMWLQGLTWTN